MHTSCILPMLLLTCVGQEINHDQRLNSLALTELPVPSEMSWGCKRHLPNLAPMDLLYPGWTEPGLVGFTVSSRCLSARSSHPIPLQTQDTTNSSPISGFPIKGWAEGTGIIIIKKPKKPLQAKTPYQKIKIKKKKLTKNKKPHSMCVFCSVSLKSLSHTMPRAESNNSETKVLWKRAHTHWATSKDCKYRARC